MSTPKLRQIIAEYLTFNRRERNGIVVLLAIIVITIVWSLCLPYFITQKSFDFSAFQKETALLEAAPAYEKKYTYAKRKWHKRKQGDNEKQAELFPFDPNKLTPKGWKKLGLNDGQIRSILKWKSKGGVFRTKKDLGKMYVIDRALYERLAPYVRIQGGESNKKKEDNRGESRQYATGKRSAQQQIEINSADTSELVKLRGIGSTFSRRMISYRKMLGGYVCKDQLKEVYGFSDELYAQVKVHIYIDTTLVKKVNINTCTARKLSAHPYIKYKVANSIVAYREQHGLYKTVAGIQASYLVDAHLYAKIAPYLRIE